MKLFSEIESCLNFFVCIQSAVNFHVHPSTNSISAPSKICFRKFIYVIDIAVRYCLSENVMFDLRENVKNIRKHIKLLRSPLSINLLLDFFPFRCVLSTGFMKVSPLLMVRWAFLVFWMSSEEKSIKQISESEDGIARRGSSVIIPRLGFPRFHEKFNACFIPFYAQLAFTTARHKKML